MLYLQQSIGIDLRDNTLRIVHLGRTLRDIVLVDYLIKKYPPLQTGSAQGSEDGLEQIALDLRNFIRDKGIKPDQIVMGLPKEKVILKEMALPKVEERELQEMLRYELEKHIPFPIEEISFDYHILRKDEQLQHLLIGMVTSGNLQKCLRLLEPGQMPPAIVDITTIAEMNWLIGQNNLSETGLAAVIDIGDETIELGILQGKEIKLARSLKRRANRVFDAFINEHPVISEASSQESILHVSNHPPGEDQGELSSPDGGIKRGNTLSQDIIRELSLAMNTLSPDLDEERTISHLILTGLDAYDSFLSDSLTEATGIETRLINPFKTITTDQVPGKVSSSLAVATALAMRGLEDQPVMFNLLPDKKKGRKRRNTVAVTITFFVLVLILSAAWGTGLVYQNHLVYSVLAHSIKKLQPEVMEVNKLSKEIEKLDKEILAIVGITDQEMRKLDILKELTTIFPADTWIDRLQVSNEKLDIDGYSEAPSNLISLLEVSPMLHNVQFASSIRKLGTGKERFKIKAEIERQKAEIERQKNDQKKQGKK